MGDMKEGISEGACLPVKDHPNGGAFTRACIQQRSSTADVALDKSVEREMQRAMQRARSTGSRKLAKWADVLAADELCRKIAQLEARILDMHPVCVSNEDRYKVHMYRCIPVSYVICTCTPNAFICMHTRACTCEPHMYIETKISISIDMQVQIRCI